MKFDLNFKIQFESESFGGNLKTELYEREALIFYVKFERCLMKILIES